MFTGLIREIAKVIKYENRILEILAKYKPLLGDSISVNGVCLTVIKLSKNSFSVEVADETYRIIPKDKFIGQIHIEPAMQIKDRFEGHIVQGHIDTIGEISEIKKGKNAIEYIIKVDIKYITYIIPKGSISIDGISLTINEVWTDSFSISIIPYTLQNTLIKNYKIGTKINIETDMFARYVEHIFTKRKKAKLTWKDIDFMQMNY